ncbi:MAG: GerAB/ArcD/ProY family transporter [Bacilli bacterium]|nr:GerAB/ArcD/ProY family transporter [Bacilli bacterium]
MNKDSKISPLEVCFLSSFLYRSFYIIGFFNLIIKISKEDSIFSIIISSILGLMILYGYFYINNSLPNHNIFNKIKKTFPKIISDFLISILIVIFIFISGFVLYNLSIFIKYNLLNDISIIPISILLIIAVMYISSKGINTITRVSGILIFIFILFVIISFISLINYSNPINIYPLLTNNFFNIYEGSIYSCILSVTPIFLLLIIPKVKIEKNSKYHKYMLITYIVNYIYILISFILVISILGVKLANIINYPDIVVLQKVSLLHFIERIEDLLSFKVMFDGFIFLSLATFYIKEGINNLFNIKPNKTTIMVINIFILITSLYLRIVNIKIIVYLLTIILFIHCALMLFIRKK